MNAPSPFLFNVGLVVLLNSIRQEKGKKGIKIEKEEINRLLCTNDMIVYVENLKELTENSSN